MSFGKIRPYTGNSGFTIVELLVVIVVIGILASLTVVAYTGISQRAVVSSLQSDLDNASKQLKLYQVDYGVFPAGLRDSDDCPTGPTVDPKYCLKHSSGNDFNSYSSASSTFSLCSTNVTTKYCITNDSGPVAMSSSLVLSNSGGGTWAYKRPITITNSSGGPLTDYQVQINPFSNANFLNNAGLVGSWHLNGGTSGAIANGAILGFDDMSGNSYNGVASNVNGTGMAWSNGRFGGAVNFDGTDDYASVGDVAHGDTPTIEVWFKADVITGKTRTIVDKAHSTLGWPALRMSVTTAGALWAYYSTPVYAQDLEGIYTADGVIQPGNWYHAVWTKSGDYTTQVLYVNGSAVSHSHYLYGGHVSTSINDSTRPMVIGRMNDDNGWLDEFDGIIDEVKIYNRALSATEVSNRYNSGIPKVRGDYADIRFTNSTGTTEYPYWQETDGKYWVKIPSLATGDTTINMYYGSTSAISSSSGTNTFDFFENAESYTDGQQNPGGWSQSSTSGGAGSTFYVKTTSKAGTMNIDVGGNDGTCDGDGAANFTSIAQKAINLGAGSYSLKYNYISYYQSYGGLVFVRSYVDATQLQNSNPEAGSSTSVAWANNTYSTYTNTFNGPVTNLKLGSAFNILTCGSPMTVFDNIYVRKYNATEPTHTVPGAETAP